MADRLYVRGGKGEEMTGLAAVWGLLGAAAIDALVATGTGAAIVGAAAWLLKEGVERWERA